jgi:D-hexose-6-phosphate mutarotase
MTQTDELQKKFGIPGVVRIEPGNGGLTRISINAGGVNAGGANGEIYLHGAHITQFQPAGGGPVLFMSNSSLFAPGKPIRGGVPVIFPWFGARAGHPESPPHGFARVREWSIESADQRADGSVRIVLALSSDAATLALWPAAFSLRLIAIFAVALDVTLEVRNQSAEEFEFEEALHTYLKIGNIHQTGVEGLDSIEFVDKVAGGKRGIQPPEPIQFIGETDRVYLNTTGACLVRDRATARVIKVEKEGSRATVVWNPWFAKAKAMPDFGDDEWPGMLCIEAANAMDCAVRLGAGQTHRMRTMISVAGGARTTLRE